MKFATPILPNYPVQEFTLGHNVPGFEPMTVVRWDSDSFLSRLVLSEEERKRVAETGEIYLFHGSVGGRFLPLRAQVEPPEFRVTVFRAHAGDEERVFHGFEVRDAGGTDAEREAYAAEEAAQYGAARMTLPARAALLRRDMPWLEGGGESHETPEGLERALATRIAATARTGQRLEVHGREGDVLVFTAAGMTEREALEADTK
jgi:hypothetical protein